MEFDRIKELIQIMDQHHLLEIEIEEAGRKIRLRRSAGQEAVTWTAAPPALAPDSRSSPPEVPTEPGQVEIKSPMVGTFYRSPSPDADPYVEVGDRVDGNTVLCIIEAMKVMNEIKAEISGVVRQILVNDGEAVEYGQPMFVVAPA